VTAGLDIPLLRLTAPFCLQNIGKCVLTEGEKLAMVAVAPLPPRAQGAYALVHNLGSLVARIVFQPVEEAAAVAFGAMAIEARAAEADTPEDIKRLNNQDDEVASVDAEGDSSAQLRRRRGHSPAKKAPEASDSAVASERASAVAIRFRGTLLALLRGVSLLAMILAALGPHYALSLFAILYREAWTASPAPSALGLYCLYMPCMALNGVLEAALYSSASPGQLLRATRFTTMSSLVYIGVCVATIRAGGGVHGLIIASAVSMALRIGYCTRALSAYTHSRCGRHVSVGDMLPGAPVMAALLGASLVSLCSQAVLLLPGCTLTPTGYVCDGSRDVWFRHAAHIAVGFVALVVVMVVVRVKSWYIVTDIRECRVKKS
jgi:oligosaccharide translocation protein RFT1